MVSSYCNIFEIHVWNVLVDLKQCRNIKEKQLTNKAKDFNNFKTISYSFVMEKLFFL